MKKKSLPADIKTLGPETFTKLHIRADSTDFYKKAEWDDFVIYELAFQGIKLKYPVPPHRKIVNDLIFVHKGSLVRTLNTDRYTSDAHTLTFVPALTITESISMEAGTEGFYCHFSDKFIVGSGFRVNDLVRIKSALPSFLRFDKGQAKIIYRLLQRIAYLYQQKNQLELIRLYLLTFLKEVEMYALKQHLPVKSKSDVILGKLKTLVSEHLYEERGVAFYASLLHISPNHLNKLIKTSAGIPATTLINQMVILEIKVLLMQTNLSISEIAFKMNFSDVSYFSKFFSKHTHTNPSAFRKMLELYKA
jgi:AraC family transcriptional activator of pobA